MLIEPTKQKLHSGGGQSFKQVWLLPQSFFIGPIGKVLQELRQFVLQRFANSTWDNSLSQSIPHICHLYHLYIGAEKSVMWRNFRFQYMTDVEEFEISPHAEEFQIFPHDRREEI